MGMTKFRAPAGKAKGIGPLVSQLGTNKILTKLPAGSSEGTPYSAAAKEGVVLRITDPEKQAYELQKKEEEEKRRTEEAKKKPPSSDAPSHVKTRFKAAKSPASVTLLTEPITAQSNTLVEKVVYASIRTQQQLTTPGLTDPKQTTDLKRRGRLVKVSSKHDVLTSSSTELPTEEPPSKRRKSSDPAAQHNLVDLNANSPEHGTVAEQVTPPATLSIPLGEVPGSTSLPAAPQPPTQPASKSVAKSSTSHPTKSAPSSDREIEKRSDSAAVDERDVEAMKKRFQREGRKR